MNQRVTPVVVPEAVQSSCLILREAYSESAAKEDTLKMGLYFCLAATQFAGGEMKTSKIYELLGTQGSGATLKKGISAAMPAYRQALETGEAVRPIDVISDGALLVIAASHLACLCDAFLKNFLDVEELGYVATALDRAPDFKFVTKEVEECAFLLSSSDQHGPPSHEAVTAIYRLLRERAV